MSIVLLDSGPLGNLANPGNPPHVAAYRRWVADLQIAGWRVILPEIIDYEVRRELLHRRSAAALQNLNWLKHQLEYLPVTTAALLQAAEFWATARHAGVPTSGSGELDTDVILAAQAYKLGDPNAIIATANVGHLSRFVRADLWSNIVP